MQYKIIKPETISSSMMNNAEMVIQFVEIYLAQCPDDFKQLEDAVQKRDRAQIASAAHHIKPTMEYIGASDLRIQFQELENLSKENTSYELIEKQFEKLRYDFNLLLKELQLFRNDL